MSPKPRQARLQQLPILLVLSAAVFLPFGCEPSLQPPTPPDDPSPHLSLKPILSQTIFRHEETLSAQVEIQNASDQPAVLSYLAPFVVTPHLRPIPGLHPRLVEQSHRFREVDW